MGKRRGEGKVKRKWKGKGDEGKGDQGQGKGEKGKRKWGKEYGPGLTKKREMGQAAQKKENVLVRKREQ